jgi:replication factor A1
MELNEIIQKIKEATGLSEEEIKRKIREKQAELYGLVSPEGAAHVLARELGIELEKKEYIKIKDLKPGLNRIFLKGRISRIFVREFEKNGEKKKVANVFLIDDTGEARLCLWNGQVDRFAFKEGDAIEILNGYTRKNIFGETEIRVGALGEIRLLEDDSSLPPVQRPYSIASINQLMPGGKYAVRASIVYIFNTNVFFEACPECGSIIKESTCNVHGKVEPEPTICNTR